MSTKLDSGLAQTVADYANAVEALADSAKSEAERANSRVDYMCEDILILESALKDIVDILEVLNQVVEDHIATHLK